jgi:phosphate-selective porin OprO/OprP
LDIAVVVVLQKKTMVHLQQFTSKAFMVLFALTALNANAQLEFPSHEEGFSITAADGSAKMNFGFRVQSLVTVSTTESFESVSSNMLIRRARLKSDGYFFSKKFGYKFEMGMSNRDIGNGREVSQSGSAPRLILDAVFKYKPGNNWEFWFGQTKLPGNRERVISSQSLQFVDRSLVNGSFNIDRDFGAWAIYKADLGKSNLVFANAITRGEGRDIVVNNAGGLSYTTRLDFLPMGKFASKGDYFGSDLAREQKPKLSIGVGYNYNQNASRVAGQLGSFVVDSLGESVNANLATLLIDMHFKYNGWSLMSECVSKTSNTNFSSYEGNINTYFGLGSGFVIQTGYLFKENYEFACRYTKLSSNTKFSSIEDRDEYTLGFSKYISGHNLKCQTDLSYNKREASDEGSISYRFQVEFGI